MKRSITLAAALVLAGTQHAAAQSIFASRGLGVPVPAVDARARALGGVGVALRDRNPSLINPAEAADYRFRGLSAAVQSSNRVIELQGVEDDAGANRFPLLRLIYPTGERLVLSAGYGGFLDQTWAAFADRTEPIGGDSVAVRDAIESSGGVAQLQVGAAYSLSPDLAVGLAAGVYTGELERVVTRTFTGEELPGVGAFRTELSWSQRAPFATAGLRWDVASILRLGGSVTWAGTLEARGDEGDARDFDLDLPLQVAGGVSALLSSGLLAAVSGRWSGWSDAADAFDSDAAPGDTWEIGGGLEWDGLTFGNRALPLRVGYHYSQYPFRVDGATPTERALALGAGLRLGVTEAGPLASLDAALERGSRDAQASGLLEDFWRFTVSLAVFGR